MFRNLFPFCFPKVDTEPLSSAYKNVRLRLKRITECMQTTAIRTHQHDEGGHLNFLVRAWRTYCPRIALVHGVLIVLTPYPFSRLGSTGKDIQSIAIDFLPE